MFLLLLFFFFFVICHSGVLSPKEREKPKPAANTWGTIRDFNTIKGTKIFYGSMVAFELVSEGTWLTVGGFRWACIGYRGDIIIG